MRERVRETERERERNGSHQKHVCFILSATQHYDVLGLKETEEDLCSCLIILSSQLCDNIAVNLKIYVIVIIYYIRMTIRSQELAVYQIQILIIRNAHCAI